MTTRQPLSSSSSLSSLLSQDLLGTTPSQPSPPLPRSAPISPKTSPPSSAPPSPFGTPPRSPSSSLLVSVNVPSRPFANAQMRGGSPSPLSSSSPSVPSPLSSPKSPQRERTLSISSPSVTTSSHSNTPPVPPPRNYKSSTPRSILIPKRSYTSSSATPPSFSPNYSATPPSPSSPTVAERAGPFRSASFISSVPPQQRPTSPVLAYARNNSQHFTRSTSPSSPAPASPTALSTPPAVPPRPLRKFNSSREDFEDSHKLSNPLLHRASALQRTVTDPQMPLFRMDEYTDQTKLKTASQPNSPCAGQPQPSQPSFISSSTQLPSSSDSLDDPKIESLRHLTQSNFMTAVSSLELVFESLQNVCSLKLAIELSKQILAYKRSLESACETFLAIQWEGVKQYLLDAPRPNATEFEYTPPPPSSFSSHESYTHVSALLSKTAIVLTQALDLMHYFSMRLSSPSSVSEVLTLAKCARWIKNNARLTSVSACASIVSMTESDNNLLHQQRQPVV